MKEQLFVKIVDMMNASWVKWESEKGCFTLSKGAIFPIVGLRGTWVICQVKPAGSFEGNRFRIDLVRYRNRVEIIRGEDSQSIPK